VMALGTHVPRGVHHLPAGQVTGNNGIDLSSLFTAPSRQVPYMPEALLQQGE
jgi:hypothetical protein